MREGMPTPEEFYSEHREKAHQLEDAKRDKERLDSAGVFDRAVAKISGRRSKVDQNLAKSQQEYDSNLAESAKHVDEFHREANEYVGAYPTYQTELERLQGELGPQYAKRVEYMEWPPKTAELGGYLDGAQELKATKDQSIEDRARMLAAMDMFNPVQNHKGFAGQTFMIGEGFNETEVGIHNGSRFPRWELGQDSMEAAVEIAKKNGWNNVLEVATAKTSASRDKSVESKVVSEKKVYIAVSDETARLVAQAGTDNLGTTSSLYGGFHGEKGYDGKLITSFKTINLEQGGRQHATSNGGLEGKDKIEAGQESEPKKITLIYDQENWQTKGERPVEINFDGENQKELYQKALDHLIRLEMGAAPMIAKNTRVRIGNQEMSWQEFEKNSLAT